ncbi:21235_t:CDS:2, partial [Cetraspora pellucida]
MSNDSLEYNKKIKDLKEFDNKKNQDLENNNTLKLDNVLKEPYIFKLLRIYQKKISSKKIQKIQKINLNKYSQRNNNI